MSDAVRTFVRMKPTKNKPAHPAMIAGELTTDLARAIAEFETSENSDGSIHLQADMDQEIGDPFARALMRVEADLILQDADKVGSDGYEERTPSQRRADALVELVTRCAEAMRVKS